MPVSTGESSEVNGRNSIVIRMGDDAPFLLRVFVPSVGGRCVWREEVEKASVTGRCDSEASIVERSEGFYPCLENGVGRSLGSSAGIFLRI